MASIELHLPFPPSTNRLWTRTRLGIRKTDAYKKWLTQAGYRVWEQRPAKMKGPYRISLHAVRPDNRKRDLGNLEKAVSDLLQSLGVIEDDHLCEMISMRWVTAGEGVRVILEPAGVET